MKIWLYINNQQMGPYELEELRDMYISEATPVWYEGLSDWMPAGKAPLTAVLFQPAQWTQSAQPEEQELYTREERPEQQPIQQAVSQPYNQQNAGYQSGEDVPPCPKNYLVWAIAITVCCCMIAGIIAIVYAVQVNDQYRRGNYEGAKKSSEKAQWWIIIGFTLGLITLPFSIMSMLG
jgi:hypothetical protein